MHSKYLLINTYLAGSITWYTVCLQNWLCPYDSLWSVRRVTRLLQQRAVTLVMCESLESAAQLVLFLHSPPLAQWPGLVCHSSPTDLLPAFPFHYTTVLTCHNYSFCPVSRNIFLHSKSNFVFLFSLCLSALSSFLIYSFFDSFLIYSRYLLSLSFPSFFPLPVPLLCSSPLSPLPFLLCQDLALILLHLVFLHVPLSFSTPPSTNVLLSYHIPVLIAGTEQGCRSLATTPGYVGSDRGSWESSWLIYNNPQSHPWSQTGSLS